MLVLGLTGVSGSGKGYICEYFGRYGLSVINTDKIVHELYENSKECIMSIVDAFGDGILTSSGKIDRRALGALVFSDRAALEKLNYTVHKFTLEKVREKINNCIKKKIKAVVVDAPQLFESGFDRECDKIISVISDENRRIERICKRDNITKEAALKRLANQHEDSFFIERSDYVIFNNGEDIETQVRRILEGLELL